MRLRRQTPSGVKPLKRTLILTLLLSAGMTAALAQGAPKAPVPAPSVPGTVPEPTASGAAAQPQVNPKKHVPNKKAADATDNLLQAAAQGLEQAREKRQPISPDQPEVKKAVQLGRKALKAQPDNPSTLRFLAELYSEMNFYGPAFGYWQRLEETPAGLTAEEKRSLAQTGTQLAYARYEASDKEAALAAYQKVAEVLPENQRALRWSGRILLEMNQPKTALAYWQRALALRPQDESLRYFVALSKAGVTYGLAAAEAFYDGVSAYEKGRTPRARHAFRRASRENPDYAAAWGYLGRIAFEQQDYLEAKALYARARRKAPENKTYDYFFKQARQKVEEARQP